jgi:hypothetical protein
MHERSRIVQVTAHSLTDATNKMHEGRQGNQQAIIVMVRQSACTCCCWTLKFDVPTNFVVLEEDCGQSTGVMSAGAHWCYPCNKRVACMITKDIVIFDAPVHRCPTRDNAYVDVDVSFTFRLPSIEAQVKTFVYKLGAARFDELLAAEVEEGIRNFVGTVWLSQVLDLRSEMAQSMIKELNKKFF